MFTLRMLYAYSLLDLDILIKLYCNSGSKLGALLDSTLTEAKIMKKDIF